MNPPAPAEIQQARHQAGLTQPQAAALVYSDLRKWQRWEGGESRMSPAHWELFLHKAKIKEIILEIA